ncbi:hypothetical protein [Novosphingobium sp.]|uniref:hypothetical protein n=1 Tax=Novosphingobium sp. TaxID=1874826 RepID=UPI003D112C5A
MKASILALLLVGAVEPVEHPHTYLLSIRDLPVDENSYVNEFSIDTWGVTTVATCHIPTGWTISAGSSADPSGRISGTGSLGVTWLDHKRLNLLSEIVLVRLYSPIQRRTIRSRTGEVPATFIGHATIGRYGGDNDDRKVRLTWRNVRLTQAKHCPALRF